MDPTRVRQTGATSDVSLKAGSATVGDLASKAGPAFALSYGYRTADQMYLEGEVSYSKNDWDDGFTGGTTSVGILSNLVIVSKPSSNSQLSWGFGAGSTIVRADIGVSKFLSLPAESQACLTGQVKALWEFKTSETNTFSLGYRFRFADGPSFSSGLSTNKITAHLITAGLSFAF